MAKIACTHPGKIGDALYAVPAIRWLCEQHDCKADFFTSEYCRPLELLMRQQSCIDQFIVPPEYRAENAGCGIQPWHMPVPNGYDKVYHLGFRTTPECRLVDWMSASVGGPNGLPIHYEFEDRNIGLTRPYAVLAPRGQSSCSEVFTEICLNCPIDVVQIGAAGEAIPGVGIDRTGADLVTTCNILSRAKAFFGLMSSQLVLANGFQMPKVVPYHGWDWRHVEQNPGNIYLTGASAAEMLRSAGLDMQYGKCLEESDYETTDNFRHIDAMRNELDGVTFRFEHAHRRWEYGLSLAAIRSIDARTVLDVGGGGSLFAPSAAWVNAKVTVVDPGACSEWVESQSARIGKPIRYLQSYFTAELTSEHFDAVTCLSVIEHVENDEALLRAMGSKVAPGGLVCITTDFHPSGQPQCDGHLRTYNADGMLRLKKILLDAKFRIYGHEPDYTAFAPHVNGYTFASLVMQKL